MPEVGKQFGVSPTGIPYPKLASLYPGHKGPVVEDGMILPWLSKRPPIKSEVKIATAVDTDADGEPDRIALRIVQPAEVAEGLKTPVIVRPSIYYEDPNYAIRDRAPFLGEDQYLRMGYTIVYADSLGSNQSDGCPMIMDGTERQVMADVVAWLVNDPKSVGLNEKGEAAQAPWSTGHIAMEGVSYGGTLAIMAAATGAVGLEAIVPVASISSAYDYFQRYNGTQITDTVSVPGFAEGYVTKARKDICASNVKKLKEASDEVSFAYNDFWKERNTLLLADDIKAATLISHGQADDNVKTQNSVQLYNTLLQKKKPVQFWFHSRDHDDPAWQKEWQKQILLWYTRYLFGVNNGVEKQPTYVRETPAGDLTVGKAFHKDSTEYTLVAHCQSGHSDGDCIQEGELLVKEDAWPAVDAVSYYFRRDAANDGLLLTPDATAGALQAPVTFDIGDDSGEFVTQPFADAVRIAGTIKVNINASFKGAATVLKATLKVDDQLITWGWANPVFYKGLEKAEPIAKDTNYEFTLEMMPRDFTVMPGSKITLWVEPYKVGTKPVDPTTVDVSKMKVELPVVRRTEPMAVMMLR
ncbi:prolyl oligopeptidase family serine peptidase [Phyllobacterium sp. SYP-B3895]|nr:prolyl oligopeptidase family serine peptidase [Phyllobacterium sp. SYP-B3895]